MPNSTQVLDISVLTDDKQTILEYCVAAINHQQQGLVVTANPEMLMSAHQHPPLMAAMAEAEWVIPDGAGVVWAVKTLTGQSIQRVPGIEFSEALLAEAAKRGWRVAIVGAEETVLNQAITNLKHSYPDLQLVYHHHGFVADADTLIPDVLNYQPNLVLAALGVPRQEVWLQKLLNAADKSFGLIGVGIGGSVDVWSGTKQRAPEVFLKLNLEWLYRISSEPWRIKRVWKVLPVFVLKVLAQKYCK
jgi:N-acetylglucosaminyldiphosphoundecaprenol N-acetyl-beta-D-mannosaminyltransferase